MGYLSYMPDINIDSIQFSDDIMNVDGPETNPE